MAKNLIIATLVAVIGVGGVLGAFAGPPTTVETEAIVEVTVWQRVSTGELYLSTRPEGGAWHTDQEPLDMSALSRSGNFRQGRPVTVVVPVTVEIADDHGGTFETATPAYTAITFGYLEWAGDVDVIVFEVEEGTTYLFVVNARYGDASRREADGLYLNTYDAEGDHLDYDDDRSGDGYSARLSWDATYSGPLYLEIGGSTGSYALVVATIVDADTAEDDRGDDFAGATAVALGDTPGELEDSSDIDVFVLEAEQGVVYQFDVLKMDDVDTYVELYDEDGEYLDGDVAAGIRDSPRLFWEATYSGPLYIEVSAYYDVGPYTLRIAEVDGDHGDDFAGATAVGVGDTGGALEWYEDIDVFVLEAEQGVVYQIDVVGMDDVDTYVELYDEDGEYLDGDDDGGNGYSARLFWEATYSGPLYIEVSGYADVGPYTLRIAEVDGDHGDDFAGATAVGVGDTGGALEWYEDIDVFVLEAEQGVVYQIDVVGMDDVDTYVELYDEDGEYLDGDDDGGNGYSARLFWEATYSGPLYIEVGGYDVGPYTLQISKANGPVERGEAYEGIGAYFTGADGAVQIVSPYPDSPAERAGIRAGDIVLAVDGESTDGWTLQDVVLRVRGPRGTQVVLTVRHTDLAPGPETEDITIVRDLVTYPGSERN